MMTPWEKWQYRWGQIKLHADGTQWKTFWKHREQWIRAYHKRMNLAFSREGGFPLAQAGVTRGGVS
jgi:hypothetical protein